MAQLWASPHTISIIREIWRSDSSSIFQIMLNGTFYAMKVVSMHKDFIGTTLTTQFHDNGDPGFTKNGRDLNRFRCELKTYQNLHSFGVCERGHVPNYYGYIDRLDPITHQPYLDHFRDDKYSPQAILLEYLPNAEQLNCTNYSNQRFRKVMDGINEIHGALIHHHDVYPKNILIVPGDPERVLWIDFDVAVAFPSKASMGHNEEEYSQYEFDLIASFGELLVC